MHSNGPEDFIPVRTSRHPHGGLQLATALVSELIGTQGGRLLAVLMLVGLAGFHTQAQIVSLSLFQSLGCKIKTPEGSFLPAI